MNDFERTASHYSGDPRVMWVGVTAYVAVPLGVVVGGRIAYHGYNGFVALAACAVMIWLLRAATMFAIGYLDGRYQSRVDRMLNDMRTDIRTGPASAWKDQHEYICELCRNTIGCGEPHHVFHMELFANDQCPFPGPPGRVCNKCAPRVAEMFCKFAEDAGFSFSKHIHNPLVSKTEVQ